MRRHPLLALPLFALFALANCSAPPSEPIDGAVGVSSDAIAYGTADSTHSAVVALLAGDSNGFSECSGTVVQLSNGQGYVLTAAHCCNMGVPSIVVTGTDYSAGEQALFTGNPQPPAYAVTANSVYYDSNYNQQDHDFCMLKFAAPAGQAVIPVATSPDGLSLGVELEHVGFGVTESNSNNSVRRTATNTLDQQLTSLVLVTSQGGSSHIPGVCEGDSGGPALYPAGVPQTQQHVVGTTSYGDSATCSQATVSVESRVISETGAGGFISSFLADAPTGTPGGQTSQPTCDTCATASETGACASQAQTCGNDAACAQLSSCLGGCTTTACQQACEATAGTTAVNELNAFDDCICSTACPTECAAECGGATSSSSGGGSCGLESQDANCNACLDASCCSEAITCSTDTGCTDCLVAAPPASCSSEANYAALVNCLASSCASTCGVGTGASSTAASTSATTGTASGPTTATTGSGSNVTTGSNTTTGAGGASVGSGSVGAGGSAPKDQGGAVDTSGGCATAPARGDSAPFGASFAVALVALAFGRSRRRVKR